MELSNFIGKLNGINSWIEGNKNKDEGRDPNLFQMVECLVDYGTIAFENPGLDMGEAKAAIEKMFELRKDHPAFKDELISEYYGFIKEVALAGKYVVPVDEEDAAIKKFILTTAAGVYFYIWQTKQREPNYQYDNVGEFRQLKDSFALYDISAIPQFSEIIGNMIDGIDKNYKYSENKQTGKQI